MAAHAATTHVVDGPAAGRDRHPRRTAVTVLAQTTEVASLVEAVVEKARQCGVDGAREHRMPKPPLRGSAQPLISQQRVDLMVVIGGKASANTMRLAEYARDKGVPVSK